MNACKNLEIVMEDDKELRFVVGITACLNALNERESCDNWNNFLKKWKGNPKQSNDCITCEEDERIAKQLVGEKGNNGE